jgi:hypothetical protein
MDSNREVSYQYLHPKTIYTDCIYRKIHKKSKGQTLSIDLPLFENDITNNLGPQKPVIYSRYLQDCTNKKVGPLLTRPQPIMNIQMNLIFATAFYKVFKLSI